ncbi:O-antigen ligase family protein [Rhodovulum marinum]|nr:O-antigen ligase family protein [Rhodovulum marinum]
MRASVRSLSPALSRPADRTVADRLQGALGWAALLVAMAAALVNGGVYAVASTLMALAALGLFTLQVVLDMAGGLPVAARRALVPGALWFAVLGWLLLQGVPGLPMGLHHPVWAIAPEGAAPTISADPESGRPLVMRLTAYAMIFWIMMRSALDPGRAMAFLRAFALFSAALAVYGILSRLAGVNILLGVDEHGPVRASFFNRNSYATYAAFGALANIACYYRMTFRAEGAMALRDYLERFFAGGWVHALGALLCLSALAMTASRAGGMAGVIGILVLIWALRRKQGGGDRLLWAVPAALAGFVALVLSSDVVDRLAGTEGDARFIVFPKVVEAILDRPLLGHGAGSFLPAFRPYVPLEAAFAEWTMAHNTYLENAFEFGLPAAVLFFAALGLIGTRLLRGLRTRRRFQSVPALAFACFTVAAFHSLFDFSLQIPAIAATFAAILGIGWAQAFTAVETTPRRRRRSDLSRGAPGRDRREKRDPGK